MGIWGCLRRIGWGCCGALFLLLGLPACGAETVEVAMRDETLLTTDIHLPATGEGPFPTILVRSTYGRNHPQFIEPYLERGYAVVMQDVRGMGDSEGEAYVFRADGWQPGLKDAADTVAWLLAQPWCDGRIGTVGGSALGITQMLMAPVTPEFRANVPEVAATNFYHDIAYQGGVLRKELLENWFPMIGQPAMLDRYKAEPVYNDFWGYYDVVAQAPNIETPGLFLGGWYDIFQQGTLDAFTSREAQGCAGARDKNYLVMRWSPHGPDTTPDYAYPDHRMDLDIEAIRHAFLDYYVRDKADALDDIPKVHYWVYGADNDPEAPGNEWRTAEAWPPLPTTERAFYLHQDGRLDDTEAPAEAIAQSFTFDPADPYPTKGGHNLFLPMGPYDQRPESQERTDLLRFATPPLSEPLEAVGRIRVVLHVSSDAPDTDFTAKLLDLYPDGDGRELLIVDNIRRVKTRDGYDRVAPPLESEAEVVTLEIDLWSLAWVFNTGHRIGLHISSSNYPRFEVNPNTGEDFPEYDAEGELVAESVRPARNTVHLGGVYPSALYLPVVE